jgi:hypothetical protein
MRASLALLSLLLPASPDPAAQEALPFTDGRWDLKGPSIALGKHDGRDVVSVETGVASRREVRLEDGVIEMDVQLTRRRSFVYVHFRIEADGEREEIYLRPHKSGLPDALQYAPVFQGQSAWQLYHGPGKTASVEFQPGAWTHLRLAIQGRRAALFLGNGANPVLVVDRLAREPRPGYVAVGAFLPQGTPGEGPIARFANVSVHPGTGGFAFPAPAPEPRPDPGVVSAWGVSSSFPPRDGASLPDASSLGILRRVDAGPGGLLELHRHVELPPGSRAAAAVVGLRIRAASDGVRAFDLGFSDEVTVFLAGRPLFSGDASYSFDAPRRDGLIGFEQARLYLPLVTGDNELRLLVSDSFGGWGLMGRFQDPSGLEIEAR